MALSAVTPQQHEGLFRVGLVIANDCTIPQDAIAAVASPLSLCQIVSLVLVQETEKTKKLSNEDIRRLYHVDPNHTTILYGEEGFRQILESKGVDAVYISVPTADQPHYCIASLEAKKHVLLDDPVSTALTEFREQLTCAQKVKRFVQFRTMFVHHYRVTSFLNCVLTKDFGAIESIDVRLTVEYDDMDKVGVQLPLKPGQGCIRILGRYCALISALIFSRSGSLPISAQVTKATVCDENGEALSADCEVYFTGDRLVTFCVGYSPAPTRQVLEVRSRHRSATMNDFVIPHRDRLATYRIYKKEVDPITGQLEVTDGDALDVPMGPSQGIMMWRQFRELCASVEEQGWTEMGSHTMSTRELTSVALQTKRILTALEASLADECEKIAIDAKEFNV